jgi:hypothetical protein
MPETKYIVRRSFKTQGEFYPVGTILTDISDIKLSKIKLNEGKIVLLPQEEDKRKAYTDYFLGKTGVDLEEKLSVRASKGSKIPEAEVPKKIIPPHPGTTAPKIIKPVIKPLSGKEPTK